MKSVKKTQPKKKKKQITFRSKFSKGFYRYLPIFGLLLFVVYRTDLAAQFFGDLSAARGPKNTQHFRQSACQENAPESAHNTTDHDPYTFNSDIYQTKIARPNNAPNFIANNQLSIIDANTGAPAGFIANTEAGNTTYNVLNENGSTFLRTEQQTPGEQAISGSWLHTGVPLESAKTYGASVEYRSNVDASILLEFTAHDGKITYQQVGLAEPAKDWKLYATHFDNTSYNAASVRLIVAPINKGMVDTRAYALYELPTAKLNQGIVSVTFDDGWQSIYTSGRPLFKKYDITTTQYIVAENAANEVPGYMTIGEIKALAKDGHEIGSHSLRHCNQAKLSVDNVAYDAEISKRVLTEAGFRVTAYAHPYGGYTDDTVGILREHYKLLRSSDDGFNDRYFDPLNLRTKTIYENTSNKEVQSWLDEAKANKQWLVLMYHRVDETGDYTVSSKQLEQQLQMIHASGLPAMTVSQAAASIR
jgi:peptidoglycan/xylan/chitin deacetylase (PgdA/CDA1 family)